MADLGFTRDGTLRKNPELVSDAMNRQRWQRQADYENYGRSLKLLGQRADDDMERNCQKTGKLQFVKKNWDNEANNGKCTKLKTCDWAKAVGGKISILQYEEEEEKANMVHNCFKTAIDTHNKFAKQNPDLNLKT